MASASASPNELEANTAVISHTGDLVTIRECFVDGIQKVVVWFYPKASTGGWTKEGQVFEELLQDFRQKGCLVMGCSVDSVEMNADFAATQRFSYPLLCDEDRTFSLATGATSSPTGKSKRIFAVISSDMSFTTMPCSSCEDGPRELLSML